MNKLPGKNHSLWTLTVSPLIWVAHFMACYLTAAIWCAKIAGRDGALNGVRALIVIYTLLALSGIGVSAWKGWRAMRSGTGNRQLHSDTPDDRHRFLGSANLLLSLLSAVATLFAGLVAVFFEDCS